MKNNIKSLTAILAATLLFGGAGFVLSLCEDAYADSDNFRYVEPTTDYIVFFAKGRTMSANIDPDGFGGGPEDIIQKPDWLSYSNGILTGTPTSLGIYTVQFRLFSPTGDEINDTIKIHVVDEGGKDLVTIRYTHRESSSLYTKIVATGYITADTPTYTARELDVDGFRVTKYIVVSKKGTGPDRTYATPGETFEFNSSDIFGFKTLSLYASELTEIPELLDMPYTAPSDNAVANKTWTYVPTSVSGTTITITGVDWLHVSGDMVYGVPPEPGTYDITVTMSKAGYEDRSETFTLTVVSELVVLNSPSTGAIVFVR